MKDTQLALRCNELLGCSLIENAHAGFLRSTAGRQHDSPNLINEQSERQRRAFVHFTQYDFSNPFQLEQPNAAIDPRAIEIIDESRAIASRVESLVGQRHECNEPRDINVSFDSWIQFNCFVLAKQ